MWQTKHPKLAAWAEEAIAEGLTVFDFPDTHRQRLRSTNMLERVNREMKRRTRVVSIFPNMEACLRLISAMLAELDDEWMSGIMYMNFSQ